MYKVDVEKYPKSRAWDEKVFTMPNIPRGSNGYICSLRYIIQLVLNGESPNTKIEIDGSESKITLNEACIRLRPMRLVNKDSTGWIIPESTKLWIDSEDNFYLAALLCANVKFLAEILYYLDTPKKASELQEIAIYQYDMNWKTTSGLNGRLIWLRQLGLVDFQEFSLLYSITEAGRSFLKTIQITDPAQILKNYDETSSENNTAVSDWANNYYLASSSIIRKPSIGYYPGNISDVAQTVSNYLSLIDSKASRRAIERYGKENYGIADSSVRHFLSCLSNINFIERKTDEFYELTDIAKNWMEKCNLIDLIVCLHVKCLFILELICEVKDKALSYKELATVAKISYGFEKESPDEIRKRVAILKEAKLIMNASPDKYIATNRGRLITEFFGIVAANHSEKHEQSFPERDIDFILSELHISSRDSYNPERFEKSVKIAFEKLGFNATLLGGSGKTDVLLYVAGPSDYSYTVTVDAKSTASGSVNDSLVDFDTLEEHRKKHGADYTAVVGCAFQNERLIKRAIEHNVVLIDVDALDKMIRNHMSIPLMLTSYRKLFDKPGKVDLALLNNDREAINRYGMLMHSIMYWLIKESQDPSTAGVLEVKELYRSIRDQGTFEKLPTFEEISAILEFLSSPLIRCVEKQKDGFFAIGSLEDASRKFEYYSKACHNKDEI